MIITKDEARILFAALDIAKYDLVSNLEKGKANLIIKELQILQAFLITNGVDNRRNGRKSHDRFSDLLTRYKFKNGKTKKCIPI
jgi:hypothetical protein